MGSTLGWQAPTDPDGDPITYDVYFGTTTNPGICTANLTSPSLMPDPRCATVQPFTVYFWRVVAKDNHGGATSGPEWWFKTGENALPAVSNPTPPDDGNGNGTLTLTWQGSDPDAPPQLLTYAVYFGIGNPPPLIAVGLREPHIYPGVLTQGFEYFWRVDVYDGFSNVTGPVWSFVYGTPTPVATLPTEVTLGPNHPNPFNPRTMIPYTVPASHASAGVRLVIHDASGRVVRVLVDETQSAGAREATWDGTDQNGSTVSSGVYFCHLQVGDERRTRKLVLLK
jgi:hypothetical protein